MAFPICAPTGGSLPTFKTMQEFSELFHAFGGSIILLLLTWLRWNLLILSYHAGGKEPILWGEVDKVGSELFWCEGGAKLPSEAVINGNMNEPFFLVSLNEPTPNLIAVNLNSTVQIFGSHCVYSQEIYELCKTGNRTIQPTFFEKLLKKYNSQEKIQ